MRILPIIMLAPIFVFGQHNNQKYELVDSGQLARTESNADLCSFKLRKIVLIFSGGRQKVSLDKGQLANERLKKCKIKTRNTDWEIGSTEIRFKDKNGNDYWIYLDNEGLNFNDWTKDKKYLLYLKVLDGTKKLFFLDDIERVTSR